MEAFKPPTPDANNRLLTEAKTEGGSTVTTIYTYDPNGNTLSKSTPAHGDDKASNTVYAYNSFNQLTGLNIDGTAVAYAYNAQGIRTAKRVNHARTAYLLDGGNVVAEVQNNTVTDNYLRGINLIRREATSETEYYLFNAHGDVVTTTNPNGTINQEYDYDAFGNEKDPDSLDGNPFRYCGEYLDAETGSYYLRARYYEPQIGRLSNEDTYIGQYKEPLSLNKYTYALNNPVQFVDYSGHFAILASIIAVAGGAALSAGINLVSQLISGTSLNEINWRSVGASAVSGAVTTAMGAAGAAVGLYLSLQGSIISGALVGATGHIIYHLVNGTQTSLAGILFAAEFGSLLSGISYQIGVGTYGFQQSGSVLEKANYAQKTYSENFSKEGSQIYSDLAGSPINSVSDLAQAIKNGQINYSDIPVHYIVRDGNTLILNTRTAQALTQAGISRDLWNAVDVTGIEQFEQMLTNQLVRNNLSSAGISFVVRK